MEAERPDISWCSHQEWRTVCRIFGFYVWVLWNGQKRNDKSIWDTEQFINEFLQSEKWWNKKTVLHTKQKVWRILLRLSARPFGYKLCGLKSKNNRKTQNTLRRVYPSHFYWETDRPLPTSTTKAVPTTLQSTDHRPLFCIPIKSGSLLDTVHSGTLWPRPPPPTGQRRLTTAYCGLIVMGSGEEPALGWPALRDWCRPDLSGGLLQRFWRMRSCN